MFAHHTYPHCGPAAWTRGFQGSDSCYPFARLTGDRHGRFDRFFAAGGGGRERFFDAGDLQLIILSLLAEKPSYGYELIKAIEERMGGGYAPSPGVVYPTLTLLEERGFARIEPTEGNRKVYGITEEGRAELAKHVDRLRDLTGRVDRTGQRLRRGRVPEVRRAFGDLRRAVLRASLRGRETGEGVPEATFAKIIEAIEHAAQVIDTL